MKQSMLFFFVLSHSSLSCNSTNTWDEVCGHYDNKHDPLAIQYIELKSDSTFIHEYRDKQVIFRNTGKWSISDDGHDVFFDKWKNFGDYSNNKCVDAGCYETVQLLRGELRFDYDQPEVNFTKVEKD